MSFFWLMTVSAFCGVCASAFALPFGGLEEEERMIKELSLEDEQERNLMVESQLKNRGIKDLAVLRATRKVPRHLFVPEALRELAYRDSPLPIGYNQTISQPYIVALTCQLAQLSSESKVLEIGTGSGYQAAILGEIAKDVYTIEIVDPLAETAKKQLSDLGYTNVHVKKEDGYLGWKENSPYDVIILAAASPKVPPPLVEQLKEGGRLIMPLIKGREQYLISFKKTASELKEEFKMPVMFVPLTRKFY